jgi:hypothetical protein
VPGGNWENLTTYGKRWDGRGGMLVTRTETDRNICPTEEFDRNCLEVEPGFNESACH